MELIDKASVVAEIESERKYYLDKEEYDFGWNNALDKILSFLDTLEVKEVDLEKYYHEFLQKEWLGKLHLRTVSEMMAFTAKHFFELGMQVSNKAQKGK